jgi:hypothetical protein
LSSLDNAIHVQYDSFSDIEQLYDQFESTCLLLAEKLAQTMNVIGMEENFYLDYSKLKENLDMNHSLLTLLNEKSEHFEPELKETCEKTTKLLSIVQEEKIELK